MDPSDLGPGDRAVVHRLCQLCGHELIEHGPNDPEKAGCLHCNGCGSCFLPDGVTPRPGHAPADLAPVPRQL